MRRAQFSISSDQLAGALEIGAQFLRAVAKGGQNYGQSSRSRQSSSKQRWTPGEKAPTSSRRRRQSQMSGSQSGQQAAFATIVPTSSPQEHDQIVALLAQNNLGGTPTKQKLVLPNS